MISLRPGYITKFLYCLFAAAAFTFSNQLSFVGYAPALADVSLINQQDSFYWYQEAKYQAVNRKNYEKALEQCEKALKLNPDNQHARALKTWLSDRVEKIGAAKRMKAELSAPKPTAGTAEVEAKTEGPEKTADAPPKPPSDSEELENNINYYQGLKKLSEGAFDEANDMFKADLVDNPERLESWFYVFKYTKDNGDEKTALHFLKKLREKIRNAPKDSIPKELMANIYNQCQMYQEEAILQKGIYRHNSDIDIKNGIKGNFDWKAVSLIPETSEIFLNRKILAAVDIAKLKESRSIPGNFSADPKNFKIDMNGRVAADRDSFRKKPKIEIPLFVSDASQKIRNDVEKLLTEGDYYAFIGVYERAEAFYNEALVRDPKSPIANNNKGIVLKVKGHYEEAIKYFRRAISYDRSYVEAYNNLATVYSERENYEEALKLFLVALKLNPREAGIHYNIGIMYHKLGRLDQAREYLLKAIEISRTADPAYYYQLGQVNLKKGNRREAYNNLKKVSMLVDKKSEIYQKVVEILRTFDPE